MLPPGGISSSRLSYSVALSILNTRRFTNKEYMQVYHVCYHMCTQRSPSNWSEELYKRHGKLIKAYLGDRVLPKLKVGASNRL